MKNRRKTALFLALVLTMSCALCACAAKTAPGAGTGDTVTVTDHSGNTVTLPAQIERIAVCDIFPLPSVLALFFNSAEKIVAMAPTSMSAVQNGLVAELYPEILNADTSTISGMDVNTEELMKLDPQVVFYNASDAPLGEALRRAGLPAVAVSVDQWDYNAAETLNQWIDLLSQIFPAAASDRAERIRAYSDRAMKLVQERTATLSEAERARVFFLFQYSADAILTAGEQSFGRWWADAIGAVNVSGALEGKNSVKVSLEQVYAWDPDIVLMTNYTTAFPEDLYGNTVGSYDWSGIGAVQAQKVCKMPLGAYRSYTPGADTPVTLLWLAKTVYPALFEDIDITKETMEYYKTVFDITLTEERAEGIFAPPEGAGKIDL